MSIEGAVREGRVKEAFARLRTTVREERQRTDAERAAFEAFAADVAAVDPVAPSRADFAAHATPGDRGSTVTSMPANRLTPPGAAATEAVRRAYENTVLALPFHEREYGEGYAENLRAEFGPDLAAALTVGDTFTPAVKRTLLEAITAATETRETIRESCDRELASLEAVERDLVPLAAEVRGHDVRRLEGRTFGELDGFWTRLGRIRERCDRIVAERQDAISTHRDVFDGGADGDEFVVYLYRNLSVTYPVCALCSEIGTCAASVRDRVETALAEAR